MAVCLVQNISLCNHHHGISPELYSLDGLEEAESMTVLYIVRSKVYPIGAGRLAPRRRWRHVESVDAME